MCALGLRAGYYWQNCVRVYELRIPCELLAVVFKIQKCLILWAQTINTSVIKKNVTKYCIYNTQVSDCGCVCHAFCSAIKLPRECRTDLKLSVCAGLSPCSLPSCAIYLFKGYSGGRHPWSRYRMGVFFFPVSSQNWVTSKLTWLVGLYLKFSLIG